MDGLRTSTSVVFDGSGGAAGAGAGARAAVSSSQGQSSDIKASANTSVYGPGSFDDSVRAANNYFSEDDKQYLAGRIHNTSMGQRDAARGREQQLGNYPYYEWNLAQNNPRGNLNGMSYPRTLRYSRLADMVNNQFHYRPGHQTNVYVGGRGFEKSADSATVSRWDPIETEEMRQMKANRELDMRSRQAGVDLQSRIQAYPQELQEAMDESDRKFQEFLSEEDVRFVHDALKYKLEKEYGGAWDVFYDQLQKKFDKELQLEFGLRLWDAVKHLTPNFMALALATFGIQVLPPDYMQSLAEQTKAQMIPRLREQGMTDEQIRTCLTQTDYTSNQIISAWATGEGYGQGTNTKSSSSSSTAAPTPKRRVDREASARRRETPQ